MTMTIDISPEAQARLEAEAAEKEQEPLDYLRVIVETRFASSANQADVPTDWDALDRIIDANQIETGIPDLAHQHDHYIHGKPKRD